MRTEAEIKSIENTQWQKVLRIKLNLDDFATLTAYPTAPVLEVYFYKDGNLIPALKAAIEEYEAAAVLATGSPEVAQ